MHKKTHTGSNKYVELSFISLACNNGCLNCAAGRRLNTGYTILVNKALTEKINMVEPHTAGRPRTIGTYSFPSFLMYPGSTNRRRLSKEG